MELFENLSLTSPFGWAHHSWRWGFHVRREDLRRYLNRSSLLLFVLGRYEEAQGGRRAEPAKPAPG